VARFLFPRVPPPSKVVAGLCVSPPTHKTDRHWFFGFVDFFLHLVFLFFPGPHSAALYFCSVCGFPPFPLSFHGVTSPLIHSRFPLSCFHPTPNDKSPFAVFFDQRLGGPFQKDTPLSRPVYPPRLNSKDFQIGSQLPISSAPLCCV